jgi:hypothetical protein
MREGGQNSKGYAYMDSKVGCWIKLRAVGAGFILVLFVAAVAGLAQTQVDFSAATSNKPTKTGGSLPPVCSIGETFFMDSAPASQNLYGCVSTNTWVLLGDGRSKFSLPSISGQSGKFLSTDGLTAQQQSSAVTSDGRRATLATIAVVTAKGDYNLADLGDVNGKQGNSSQVQMFGGGTVNSDDCAKFDSNGNIVSSGAICGTGLPSTSGQSGKFLSTDGVTTQWQSPAVSSVLGRTGAVVKAKGDYNLGDLGDVNGKQGNSSQVQMFGGGTVNNNDCAKFDGNGNVVSSGMPCGGVPLAGTGIQIAGNSIAVDSAVVSLKNEQNTYLSGAKQTFQASASTAPIRVVGSAEPSAPQAGDVYFDSTSQAPAWHTGSVWHHAMSNPGTTTGDMFYCSTSTTPCSPSRLPAGASGTFLMSNGTGLAPSFQMPNATQIANAFDKSTSNALGANSVLMSEMTPPSNPTAGNLQIYVNNVSGTSKLCSKDAAGIETCGLGGAASSTFDTIGSGTNTTAAMIVASGASLSAAGTGTVEANRMPQTGLFFTGETTTKIYRRQIHKISFEANSSNLLELGFNGARLVNGRGLEWTNGGSFSDTPDTSVIRSSAGMIDVAKGGTATCGTASNCRDLRLRHVFGSGAAPTIASGFGATPSISGADIAGRVTVGGGETETTGVITFGTEFPTAPACVANNETSIQTVQARATTTTLTLTGFTPFGEGDKLTWICVGY